jgi:hypothetical protein
MSRRSAAAFLAQHRKACGAHNDGKLRRPDVFDKINTYEEKELLELAARWAEDHVTCHRTNCSNEATEPHTCPFAEEIRADYETLCTCCPDCAHECAMDI